MPLIRIVGQDSEVVYQGPGELIITHSAYASLTDDQTRIELHQEEVRGGEVRGRTLDLTEFLHAYGGPYTLNHRLAEQISPLVGLDPGAVDGIAMLVPSTEVVVELWIDLPAVQLSWLKDILEQSFETPEERRVQEEARHEAYYRSVSRPDAIRACFGFGSAPRADVGWERVRQNLLDVQRSMDRMSGAGLIACEALQGVLRQAAEAESEQDRRRLYEAEPEPDVHQYTMGEYLSRLSAAIDIPQELLGPDPAHDELIESTRSEFPHDPLAYGQIYPGDIGTSHWTPPEDPDEKIRSCP